MSDEQDSAISGRSPAYPYVSLKRAVELAKKTFEYAKHSEADVLGLYKFWGFKGETGSSKKTLAAMRYFGLLERAHASKNIKLSARAKRILLDPDATEARSKALVEAFLSPAMYKYCWELWGNEMPHDNAVKSHLMFKKGFNHATVDGFLDDYKTSVAYSGIASSATIQSEDDPKDDEKTPEVGDLVQWESAGQIQFAQPRKVRAIQDHDGQPWVFVEGSETGIPMTEVAVIERAPNPAAGHQPLVPPSLAEVLAPKEREWIRGPLAKDVSYRIIVSGDLGPKEIAKLIKMLQAQKDILSDDDEEDHLS
jgi:hypothetical protein